MGEKNSYIRKAIELLEDNGFYVFKAEEELDPDEGYPYPGGGTIELKMIPKELLKHN
jgi:hypothetical protein